MALKFVVKDINEVPEAARSLYVKDEASGEFRLPVEGVVPKEKLDEFRTNNINLLKERDDLKSKYGSVDLDEYVLLKTEKQKNKEKKLIDENKIEELLTERVTTMKTAYDGQINDLTTKFNQTRARLETVLIDSELQREAIAGGCLETATEDIVWRGRQVFHLKDDKVIPLDGDKVLYGPDGSTPLSIKEWLAALAGKAPHLFKQSKGGGSNNPGSGFNGGTVGKKSDLKSPADKAAYIGKHGRDAYLSLPA